MSSSIASGLASTTHDLPMFHDGEAHHRHQPCSRCNQIQRTHANSPTVKRAASLGIVMDLNMETGQSKDCQVADWPEHKTACKSRKAHNLAITKESGIAFAMQDFEDWKEYYEAPLKNCAIAAMRLPENPHMKRKAVLRIELHHEGDSTLPVHHRFTVRQIDRRELWEMGPGSNLRSDAQYIQNCERGKLEFGKNFYGVVRIGFYVLFDPLDSPAKTEEMKSFSIDRATSRSSIVRQDWWILFREYVTLGAKMRFCCGRLEGLEDICCCGGLVHDAEKLMSSILS
ncbi:hypothetical protein DFH07DRAFT_946516 [Mycena maculata]|uniref:MYND-type domain-containing protein n=1 Tax=Mycena maculata TaxID=230809 RepID=A0AAD7HMA4_9AGAR|nr:hypothetical protein DFH07DRAFT_946516 [Mycena maculata]